MKHFDCLEPRELLSSTVHPTPKPMIPNIVGQYVGTDKQKKPNAKPAQSLAVNLTNETAKGKLAGTLRSGTDPAAPLTGTINAQNQFVGKFRNGSSGQGTLIGTYNRTTHTLSGHFTTPGKSGQTKTGVFSMMLVV